MGQKTIDRARVVGHWIEGALMLFIGLKSFGLLEVSWWWVLAFFAPGAILFFIAGVLLTFAANPRTQEE